jgi:hypothetical protein
MKISDFLKELKVRNIVLYYFGWANFLLFGFCFIAYLFDDALITGINAWIKPMKFGVSVGIYCWTFGWLLHYLKSEGSKSIITWLILISMFAENFIITFQAIRGETSHYNISSSLNAILFSIMGAFIGINSCVNAYTTVLFFLKSKVTISGHTLVAWQLGLLLFVIGGISGGLMIANMGHTFGAEDGGAGLPFINWSTQAGDMRVAHFVTMHGLQAIPLFAWLVASKIRFSVLATYLIFILYSSLCLFLHYLAFSEKPIFIV